MYVKKMASGGIVITCFWWAVNSDTVQCLDE